MFINLNILISSLPILKIEFYFIQFYFLFQTKQLKNIFKFFKYHFKFSFKLLTCISGVDYPENLNRFKLIYEILSVKFNNRLRLKFIVNEIFPIYSIETIFINSNWWEFEIWDMFGIIFLKRKNMTRLLTDYGFQGFPLKKDFPLSGFVDSKYDLIKNRILYENLELSQNYRSFIYNSIWVNYNKKKHIFSLIG